MDLRKRSKLLYQLKVANQELTQRFEEETGFSITRYEMMMFLKDTGQCTQSDLQKALQIDGGAITRHLKILEDKAYVTRQRNQANNREVLVTITPLAVEKLKKCEEKQNKDQKDLLDDRLNQAEQEQLMGLLSQLVSEKEL